MSRRIKKRKPMAEINVVPYIDVTLVLLIIFMITAPMVQTGVDVDLPQAEASGVDTEEPPVIISIDKDGQYFITLGEDENESVDLGTLLLRVRAVRKNNPKAQIYVNGDKNVPYGEVVVLMATLKEAQVPSVGLMTSSPD
jgi:biopolymer transport protein TolR